MMDKLPYQLGVGTADIGKREKSYVNDALKHNRLSYGPYTERFEAEFARLHDLKYAIFTNSGTSALQIAVACLKETEHWQNGDEIIVPALTFIASSNVVLQNGLKPVFVDVDPNTYNIDPSKIKGKITSRTRAIMPVHICGLPCEMDPIMSIARDHSLKIIEDSCETMFARYKGKPVGSFGDISCFSTYVAHMIVTGVGGFAATNNPEYAVIMKSMMNHGRDSIYLHIDDDKTDDKNKLFEIVARRFRFIRMGYSYRCTELEAALGVGQLEKKDEMLLKRRKNAEYLIKKLRKHARFIQLPAWPSHSEHVFMMFPVVVRDPGLFTRTELVNFLEENNIETRDLLPLLNQPYYKSLFGENILGEYPVAKHLTENAFYIGCHPGLKKKELAYIAGKFDEFFRTKGLEHRNL